MMESKCSGFFNKGMQGLDANFIFYSHPDWEKEVFPAFPQTDEKLQDVADRRFSAEPAQYPIFQLDHALDLITQDSQNPLENLDKSGQFKELMSKVEQDLNKDMPANPKVIFQKYKDLENLLPELSCEERSEFDRLVNKMFILRFAKYPSNFIGTSTEELVLSSLGYPNLADYQNRILIIEKARRLILEKFEELSGQNLRQIKDKLRRLVKSERLQLAGVDPADQPFINEVIRAVRNYRKKFDMMSKPYTLRGLKGDCEIAKKFCLNENLKEISKFKAEEVKEFLNTIRLCLKNNSFPIILEDLVNQVINDPQRKFQRKEKFEHLKEKNPFIDWFNQYQTNITVEFSQSFLNSHDVNGGLCNALVHRFITKILENPAIEDDELEAHIIFAIDRFRQAASEIFRSSLENYDLRFYHSLNFPRGILKGYKESSLNIYSKDLFFKNLTDFDSAYQLLLLGSQHTIGFQIDKKRGIYRFYDPNLGVVRMFPANDKNEEKTLTDFSTMLRSWLAIAYDDLKGFLPIELLKD